MDGQPLQLKNTNFYMLTTPKSSLSLSIPQCSKAPQKQKVQLVPPNQSDLSQIWMIVQIPKYPNMCEIVHTVSTLVLTSQKECCMIKSGAWKANQLYFIQKHQPKLYNNHFLIKSQKNTNRLLTITNNTVCMRESATIQDGQVWQIIPVKNNPIINKSCYIEYAYSGMVLDVPKASQKPGINIIQYPLNNKFNQRWNIIKCESTMKSSKNVYKIQNLKTGMYLDIKGELKKPGAQIIQWKSTGSTNQLWYIEYQGTNIYQIRSVMDEGVLLGVKGNSLKEEAIVVTTGNQSECFWRIVGYIPR